jgi:hypothetical protein
MPRMPRTVTPATPGVSDVNLLVWLATCVSVFSFLFFYRQGEILLYGDAIAHINIARRVFDSRTPGLLQLGTVWLPLPHLLIIPFIIPTEMWRGGAGGSIPSMAGYVFAVIGIFRLVRTTLSRENEPDPHARFAAWIAAIVFAANPNLIYMQSTAMGESVYLAFFLWSVVFFAERMRGGNTLTKSALCLAGACLTRYDGWFLAATMIMVAVIFALKHAGTGERSPADSTRSGAMASGREVASGGRVALQGRESVTQKARALAPALIKFVLIAAAAPVLWLAYNGIIYRNLLEFANGPYSAKAIEKKTQMPGNPGHPGSGNPAVAGLYFLKSAEDNVAQNEWLQRIWILLALVGIGSAGILPAVARASRPRAIAESSSLRQIARTLPSSAVVLLFLLVPLPFYALSIAYGGVPIFVPNWWPFSQYNTRYGLQLLPALALSIALLVYFVLRSEDLKHRVRITIVLGLLAFVGISYAFVWNVTPICLKEAQDNMRTRNQLQMEVARWVEKLPSNSTLLMYTGDQVGALERAAFPLKRTINEGNHRVWRQPTDAEGLWERALADPGKYVDYVLAFEGDPVWQAVHEKHLHVLIELHVTGQPRAMLYAAR